MFMPSGDSHFIKAFLEFLNDPGDHFRVHVGNLGVNASNSGVRDREYSPVVSRDPGTSVEGHKVEVALGITGGTYGNDAHGVAARCVAWVVVIEHLYLGTEFHAAL